MSYLEELTALLKKKKKKKPSFRHTTKLACSFSFDVAIAGPFPHNIHAHLNILSYQNSGMRPQQYHHLREYRGTKQYPYRREIMKTQQYKPQN